ncbi:MAG: hypothetical protein O2975_02405 [Proteobacteria bacterium]|nr:hypothetical protein [Pseudomonadota bacterium]
MQFRTSAIESVPWDLNLPAIHSATALQLVFRQGREKVPSFDSRGLDRVLRTDFRRDHVEVQSQTTWQALAGSLERRIPTLTNIASRGLLPNPIGDDVASNAPGPDGRPMVALIESLMLVTPEGELRRASRDVNADLFALAVGGQGIFGALYSVTLSLSALAQTADAIAEPEVLELSAAARGAPHRLAVYLPPNAAESYLAQARAQARDWHLPITRVAVRRTRPETETLLRWARCEFAGITLDIDFSARLGGEVMRTQFFRLLVEDAITQGGLYAISSTPEASRDQAERCYPSLRRLLAEKLRHDPRDRLQSAWYRHHRRLLRSQAPTTAPGSPPESGFSRVDDPNVFGREPL